jgi:hypothetical protein
MRAGYNPAPEKTIDSRGAGLDLSTFRGQSARWLWVARPSKTGDVAKCQLGRDSSTLQHLAAHGQADDCSPSEACLAVPPGFRRTLIPPRREHLRHRQQLGDFLR